MTYRFYYGVWRQESEVFETDRGDGHAQLEVEHWMETKDIPVHLLVKIVDGEEQTVHQWPVNESET